MRRFRASQRKKREGGGERRRRREKEEGGLQRKDGNIDGKSQSSRQRQSRYQPVPRAAHGAVGGKRSKERERR
jgi:hypothetical protein